MKLSDELQKAFDDARAVVSVGFPWWLRPFLMPGVIAITLGRRIYVRKEIDERLLKHELVHVRQVNRLGLFRFVVQYAYEFIRNLIRERSFDRAYRAISFEREAYEAEDL